MEEHRAVEVGLDWLEGAISSGEIGVEGVRALAEVARRHYAAEEPLLAALAGREEKLAAKLRGQHDEVLEIGERLIEVLEAGTEADVGYLARRLLAMAQHNIIEEERDVFPLVISPSGVA